MGEGGASVNSEYDIDVQRPIRPRRGDNKLIIVAKDSQGIEVYRNKADLNEEKARKKVAERLAGITGDTAEELDIRLLAKLGQLAPPAPPAATGAATPGTEFPYEATPGGLIWNKDTSGEIVLTPLTTFTAKIVGQVLEDDGAETRRLFEIEAVLRGRTYRFQVPSGQFATMNWPMEHLGAGAALWPGFGIRDHARAAIQFLSGEPPERRVYAHLGWREIGGIWHYMHAGGAIGPVGPVASIEVSLAGDLERYRLPDPPTGNDLVEAVRSSLRMLDVAGDSVTVPLCCAVWRAPLGGIDSGLHMVGATVAEARRRWQPWLSTDNALENLAFSAKDALLVVDDFCPTGSQFDVQAMHRKADRVFRGLGNTAGRGRLRSDGTARPTKPPRGMVLSTGEDVPRGQSLRARMLVLEVPRQGVGAVDWGNLTACQADAAAGVYAQAMAGYLRWLAPRYREIRKELRSEINALREQAYRSGQHRRTPDNVANLAVGIRTFSDFAREVGALDQTQADALWTRCWSALGNAAAAQQEHQADSDPVHRFMELLMAVISSGRAHLTDSNGDAPQKATTWGWREVEVGTGEYARIDWRPQGAHIGWLDGEDIYLQADAAYAVVQKLARDEGDHLTVALPTLKKRLNERGMLASTEKYISKGREVERLEIRKVLQGNRRAVLHLKRAWWANTPSGSEPREPRPEDSRLIGEANGSNTGSLNKEQNAEVSHGSEPSEVVAVPESDLGGSHGSHGSQIKLEDTPPRKRKSVHWEEEL